MDLTKSLPHDLEVEQSVLAAAMTGMADEVVTVLSPSDCYDKKNGLILEAILSLYNDREAIDLRTTVDRLRKMGKLEKAGGAVNLAKIFDSIPWTGVANVQCHARILKDHAITRSSMAHLSRLLTKAYDGTLSGEAFLNEAQKSLGEISVCPNENSCQSFSDLALALPDRLDRSNELGNPGVPTGLYKIDAVMGGLFAGDLGIIAARPGLGKSALMGNFMYAAAAAGFPVLVFSLEMTKEQLFDRIISRLSNVNIARFRQPKFITKEEHGRIHDATAKAHDLPVHIDDTPYIKHMEMVRRARKYNHQHGIKAIFIDYLQLVNVSIPGRTRDLEIGEVTRTLKGLAKELSVPIVILSQLNRAIEQRNDPTPLLSDLRESGNVEQDADWVGFIFKDGEIGPDHRWFYLAKNRHGKVCKQSLRWTGRTTSFDDD